MRNPLELGTFLRIQLVANIRTLKREISFGQFACLSDVNLATTDGQIALLIDKCEAFGGTFAAVSIG